MSGNGIVPYTKLTCDDLIVIIWVSILTCDELLSSES